MLHLDYFYMKFAQKHIITDKTRNMFHSKKQNKIAGTYEKQIVNKTNMVGQKY